ncbi:hypothetical protein BGW80DRAFT_734388 [Lactifluus volemus]|nr:hypothetical protein BGW80DRAFT_734388 [Lactifluus volemus]
MMSRRRRVLSVYLSWAFTAPAWPGDEAALFDTCSAANQPDHTRCSNALGLRARLYAEKGEKELFFRRRVNIS